MKRRIIVWMLLISLLLTLCVPVCAVEANDPIPPANEPSIQIHYRRSDGAYDDWGFWIWEAGGNGDLYPMNYRDEFGGVAVYPLSAFGPDTLTKGIGIIPRRMDSWTKDVEADRMIDLSDYEMDENNYYHFYIRQGDVTIYMNSNFSVAPKITQSGFSSMQEVVVKTNTPMVKAALYEDGALLTEVALEHQTVAKIGLPSGVQAVLGKIYEVEVTYHSGETSRSGVSCNSLYATDDFNALYYYDGALGAVYTPQETTFKVWSPVSSAIVLNIYDKGHGGAAVEQVDMTRGDRGVFSATLKGDYAGKYYTYTVTNYAHPNGVEVVDPYAKSAGLNGVRGQIVDFAATNPDGWDQVSPIVYDRKELVVWETHVADVTSSKTWVGNEAWRKKFLGMAQSGTTYTENGVTVSTGFDHIVELGVNAVQIIPVFDQANDEANVSFNWGYNPLNYNVLEGAYSTDPADGYARIREFKSLVQAFHGAEINIIMDVVYNHVAGANGSNFDVLMPGYYFRYTGDGNLSNGSGCGNEFASENMMARKFIIDSVCFWADEYKLGGFRFDLMGLHDIETMNLLAEALKEVNPHIVVYGEPWCGGTSTLPASLQGIQVNANQLNGVGQFNDQMRDALIKGGLNSNMAKGWVTNEYAVVSTDVEKIVAGMQGNTLGSVAIPDPNRTVNYVTCHDNFTLYDRIRAAGIQDPDIVKKMAMLANSVVLTSNGTSFMLAGEEFLRTKGGDHNSYESSYEVNELNYALKIQHMDMFKSYQTLIQFKKTMAALHLEESEMSAYTPAIVGDGSVISVHFCDEATGRDYVIYHANGYAKDQVVDLAGYTLVLDTLNTGKKLTKNTRLEPYQTIIAYTSDEAQASKNGNLVAGLAAAAAVAVAAAAVILKRKKK
jgi:pullulanase